MIDINFHANKGMYIEELVEKTIAYYLDNKICFIEKRYLPIKIIKRNKNIIEGKLLSKSYVDYFGLIKNRYITFETKQTDNNVFMLNQIKDHQLSHLNFINKLGGVSFLILHFYHDDKTFLIEYKLIENWISKKLKKITVNLLEMKKDFVHKATVIFPGILNLYEIVVNVIDKKT